MTDGAATPPDRSYGCMFGDGNPYDYVIVDVRSGEAFFWCVPCYIRQSLDMVKVLTDPDSPEARNAAMMLASTTGEQAPGPAGRKRGHNAPATSDDPDLWAAYDDRVTADELPEAFR